MADGDPPTSIDGRWSRGERIISAAGVLLIADLSLLPWHHYSLDLNVEQFAVQVPSFRIDRTGVQDPDAIFGIAALVIALGMVLGTVAARLRPAVPRHQQIPRVAGCVVLGLLVAKLLANQEFLGIGAWLGIALAAALAYGGFDREASTGSGTVVTGA